MSKIRCLPIATPELYCRIFVTEAERCSEFINGLEISEKNKRRILSTTQSGSYVNIKDKGWISVTHVFILHVTSFSHGRLFAMYKDTRPRFAATDYSSDFSTLEVIQEEFEALSKKYGVVRDTQLDIKTQLLIYSALLRIEEYEKKMELAHKQQ